MILRTSPPSPFGRKVKIMALHCGLAKQVSIEHADTNDPKDSLRQQNPLGKIPILILDDGMSIYDSNVICEYLDTLHRGPKVFPEGPRRWQALTLAALANGILDASILQVYEKRFRPEEKQHAHWLNYQSEKVSRALTFLQDNVPSAEGPPNIGDVTLACALGYLDFRFNGDWRRDHPALVAWLEAFQTRVPSFTSTMPSD